MGLSVEYSSLVITHVIYKAALILAVVRWVLWWALRCTYTGFSDHEASSSDAGQAQAQVQVRVGSQSQSQMIRDSLQVTTYGDISWRLPESTSNTCAVCLNVLRKRDKVRELRNCSHVFHRTCIDRWVDHDEDNNSCPLCRAPLLPTPPPPPPSLTTTRTEPSWAVERLLYLFGDDLQLS